MGNAQAQTAQEIVIHRFAAYAVGANPGPVIRDTAGNFYGTAPTGGIYDGGVVYKVDVAGKPTVLHHFTGGSDGCAPQAPLIMDKNGNLYGTAPSCGSGYVPGKNLGDGVVFEIASTGQFQVLHSFSGVDGAGPQAALTLDPQGNLYGTTVRGGAYGWGVIFKLSPAGSETVLYSFFGNFWGVPTGGQLYGNLIRDAAGNLYGIAAAVTHATGALFKLDPTGTESTLHVFKDGPSVGATPVTTLTSDGKGAFYGTANYYSGTTTGTEAWKFDSGGFQLLHNFPGGNEMGGVTLDGQGNLYGNTGSSSSMFGFVYKLTPTGQVNTLYSFQGGLDGNSPTGSLVVSPEGNVYGTTRAGGSANLGVLFAIGPSGQESVIYDFPQGPDGCDPDYNGVVGGNGGLISDAQGNLYGTTSFCGAGGQGMVFKIDNTGHETVLHTFQGSADGANPSNSLLRDAAGNLYGTTVAGGSNGAGTIYKLSSSGQETILHNFGSAGDGARPNGSLIADPQGNLYGTTANGGVSNQGTVFKLDRSGNESVLYSFTGGADGGSPFAGVIRDAAGNLYGTASSGGTSVPNGAYGVVYKLAPNGVETVIHVFSGLTSDGNNPYSILTADAEGNLYGTTEFQALADCLSGTVFKIDASGNESVLFTFPCDGSGGLMPAAGVIRDSAGNLYGTTQFGGTAGAGVVYKLNPQGVETVLYNFTGILDDGRAYAGLLAGPNGVLYGLTSASNGEVFALKPGPGTQ